MQCPVNMVMSHLKKGCTDKEDLTEHIRYLSLADVTAEDKYPPVDISSRDTPDGGFLEWETPPQKTKISAIFIRYVRPSLPERPIPLAWDDSKRCGTVVPFSDMSTMLWPEISSEGSKVYVTLPVLEYITKGNVMRFVDPNKNRIANEKFCNTASDDQRKLRCYVTIEGIFFTFFVRVSCHADHD